MSIRVFVVVLCALSAVQATRLVETNKIEGKLRVWDVVHDDVQAHSCPSTTEITAPSGTFKFPAGTSAYRNNFKKCWKINVGSAQCKPTSQLKIAFTKVDIEEGYDFVTVFDCKGDVKDKDITAGETNPSINVDGCCAVLMFKSDYSVTGKGFTATYGVANSGDVIAMDPMHEENAKTLNTAGYKGAGCVVARRGANVQIGISGVTADGLSLTYTGRSNKAIKLTKAAPAEGFRLVSIKKAASGPDVFTIALAPNAGFGRIKVKAIAGATTSPEIGTICVIGNPYKQGQDEYLGTDKTKLKEYVENDQTIIYRGSRKSHSGMIFTLSGKKRVNLADYLDLLGSLSMKERKNIVSVTREWTYQVYARLLEGRWDGEYDDGKKPGYWVDTDQIMDVFRSTGGHAKYGQCWVFSGLLNDIYRSNGIAVRSVTNFDSAHERKPFDGKCHLKYKCNKEGRDCKSQGGDSVWNFHVWVDAFFRRKDVQGGDGWQALDATPQEKSDGRYQCGPCSLSYIKKNNWNYDNSTPGYDCAFVNSEVDCDQYKTFVDNTGKVLQDTKKFNHVGMVTMTKPFGTIKSGFDANGKQVAKYMSFWKRGEVGEFHKGVNVSPEYKTTRTRLRSFMDVGETVHKTAFGWDFQVVQPEKPATVGEPMKFGLKAVKKDGKPVHVSVECDVKSYDGKKVFYAGVFKAGKRVTNTHTFDWTITLNDYQSKLDKGNDFYCVISAAEENNGKGSVNIWAEDVWLSLNMHRIKLSGREQKQMKTGQLLEARFEYTNPLKIPLTDLKFNAKSKDSGVDASLAHTKPSLAPGGTWEITIKVKSSFKGKGSVAAVVSSKQLQDAEGLFTYGVAPKASTKKPRKKAKRKKPTRIRKQKATKAQGVTRKKKSQRSRQKKKRQQKRKANRKANPQQKRKNTKKRATSKKPRRKRSTRKRTQKKRRTTQKKRRTTQKKKRTTQKKKRTTQKKKRTTQKKKRTTQKKRRTTQKKKRTTQKKKKRTV